MSMSDVEELRKIAALMRENQMVGLASVPDEAADTIEQLTRERDELEQEKAELLEAFLISRQQITKACNNAVEKLRELAPDMGWDDGQSTADMYLNVTDPVLAKHSGEEK